MFWKKIFSAHPLSLSFWSMLNAGFMLWLTFWLLSIPQVLPDEYNLVQWTSVIKNLVLGLEDKPDTTRFLFVNVAWDKILVDRFDPQVPNFPVGAEPITDRAKLVALLELLNRNPNHKFIVFDIFFKGAKTEYDSTLTQLINQLPKVLVSYHRDKNDKPDYPDLKIKHISLSDIEKVGNKCLKFKILHNDSIKSTPVRIYESIYKKQLKKTAWGLTLNQKPVLNSFILDYRVRKFHYDNSKYPQVHLGEWVNPAYKTISIPGVPTEYNIDSLDTEYINHHVYGLTKDRIIFVGDFEDRDIHETIYGETPGPIILLDAFLALEAGDNVIRLGFIVMLSLVYFVISYVTFGYAQIYPYWVERWVFRRKNHKESFLENLSIFFFYFVSLSIASYFLFNIHIGVLVLAFYMNVIAKCKDFILKWLKKRRKSSNITEPDLSANSSEPVPANS
jgi:CHASE2 domain